MTVVITLRSGVQVRLLYQQDQIAFIHVERPLPPPGCAP